jgi:sec-independent protein translocase protein TatA
MMLPLALLDFLSPTTMLILAVVAILLYGERLPEVARTYGKQFMALKKSMQGIRDQFDAVTRDVTGTMEQTLRVEPISSEREEATAPKFEPPPAEVPSADPPTEPTSVAKAGEGP